MSKRRQIILRLQQISSNNQKLNKFTKQISQSPVYVKRIKLMQLQQQEIDLPQTKHFNNSKPNNTKILVISHHKPHQFLYPLSRRSHTISYQAKNKDSISVQTIPPCQIHQTNHQLNQQETAFNEQKVINRSINIVNNDVNFSNRFDRNKQKAQFQQNSEVNTKIIEKLVNSINQISISKILEVNGNNFQRQARFLQIKSHPTIVLTRAHELQQIKSNKNARYCPQTPFSQSNVICQFSHQSPKKDKKIKLPLIKNINQCLQKSLIPPPKISANSYIVCEINNILPLRVVMSYNSQHSQQIASLTKIMTCIIILQFCQRCRVNMDEEEVKIGKYQSNIGGTSAGLKPGQIYTIRQLLYGLMLPSGNDASVALAVWCGRQLLTIQQTSLKYLIQNLTSKKKLEQLKKRKVSSNPAKNLSICKSKLPKNQCYSRYIKEMNEMAKKLKMANTHYNNSHGLINIWNRSTAFDIALLSSYAMKNSVFKEIVSSQIYEGTIKYEQIIKVNTLPSQSREDGITEEEAEGIRKNDGNIKLNNVANLLNSDQKSQQKKLLHFPPIKSRHTLNSSNLIQMAIKWSNTHKLVQRKPNEYIGIKTGFTVNAGYCLASCVIIGERTYLIVVLGCTKVNLRFKETQILKDWLLRQGLAEKVKPIQPNKSNIESLASQYFISQRIFESEKDVQSN